MEMITIHKNFKPRFQVNMHHTHIGEYNAEVIKSTVILSIARLSSYTVQEFYEDCSRMGVNVLGCHKVVGIFFKKYIFEVKGMRINVQRLGKEITMY